MLNAGAGCPTTAWAEAPAPDSNVAVNKALTTHVFIGISFVGQGIGNAATERVAGGGPQRAIASRTSDTLGISDSSCGCVAPAAYNA
jgi:hypothetical protein